MKLDLNKYIPGLLLWLSNKVASSAGQIYRARFGIGVTDWRVLAYFEVYPWTTAASACELMGLDKAAVSRSVAMLQESGWLRLRPSGLRKIEYSTTPAGKKFHDQVHAVAIAREQALLNGLTTEERATLVRLFHKMLSNLDAVERVGRDD